MKLKQFEPLGMKFSEDLIERMLPAQALREMIAEKMGVDLSRYAGQPQSTNVTATRREFAKDLIELPASVIDVFAKYGRAKDGFSVQQSRDFEFTTDEELEASEKLFTETFAKSKGLDTGLPSGKVEVPPTGTPKIETEVGTHTKGHRTTRTGRFAGRCWRLTAFTLRPI